MSPEQCRGARAILRWSLRRLEEETGVGAMAVSRFEREEAPQGWTSIHIEGETRAYRFEKALERIRQAFYSNGVRFGPKGSVRVIKGGLDVQQS
jgi:transcriptional regulator with XRE-family HTH domain